MERPEHAQVSVGGKTIVFALKRSQKRKTLGIRVDLQGVWVTAPRTWAWREIEKMVLSKADWISRHQDHFKQMRRDGYSERRFVDGEVYSYLGRSYSLVRYGPEETPAIRLFNGNFEVWANGPRQTRALLEAWYRERAGEHIPSWVAYWSRRMGHEVPTILIRNQKQRWGSCNAKGELRLNWRIMLLPPELADYVIVHELAHVAVLNHSPAFWARVERFIPDYQERHERLSDYGQKYWF